MSQTAPAAIAALPTPPSTSSPSTFDSRADAFLGALPTAMTEINAAGTITYNNAVDCYNNAVIAQNSSSTAQTAASSALSASGAAVWSVATTYTVGAAVYSPVNMRIYRCIVGITGGADPSSNGTNWQTVNNAMLVVVVSGTTQTAVAGTQYVLTNVAATTVTLPASPQSTDEVWVTVANGLWSNVVNFNGKPHMDKTWATDPTMLIDNNYATLKFRYVNATWRII